MRDRLVLIWAAVMGRPICHQMHIYGVLGIPSKATGGVVLGCTVHPGGMFRIDDEAG